MNDILSTRIRQDVSEPPLSGPSRLRHCFFTIFSVIVGCMIAVVIVEALLRFQEPFFHYFRDNLNWPNSLTYVSNYHHGLTPGLEATYNLSAYFDSDRTDLPRVHHIANSSGMKDPRNVDSLKTKIRIFVLGDSFTEGYYLEDTVAARIETKLNSDKGKQDFEVFNVGTDSYSPLLEYLRIKHQLLNLKPDAFVVNIDLTDVFDDNIRYRPLCAFSQDGEPLYCSAESGRLFGAWFRERFYLARLLKVVKQSHFWPMFSEIHPTYDSIFCYHLENPYSSEKWTEHVGFFLNNICRIIEIARDNHCKMFLTTYPHKQQLSTEKGERIWNREVEFLIRDVCKRQDVPFFSAFQSMKQYFQEDGQIYWKNDMHFTPYGQRIWANQVADFVAGNW